ncbi:hypothetical protein G7Y89_g11002 [Cudoniella acicularis]|uniref:Carboxypeptidase n=1 Tax=Cudoniella acicularis TaxID=354080 RepID=A0A8H4REH2_9HELO|nr:hypothetical protein G7Y89_g11002 [Cudoniella acicularis]
MLFSLAAFLASCAFAQGAKNTRPNLQARSNYSPKHARQLPANAPGVKTLVTPQNITIRYKEPGKEGVCETTPGVNSYSGYIDLDENTHTFFWFFEARHNPEKAPTTLWLNGGPGSDSMIGLFEGISTSVLLVSVFDWSRTWSLFCNPEFNNSTKSVLMERSLEYAVSVTATVNNLFLCPLPLNSYPEWPRGIFILSAPLFLPSPRENIVLICRSGVGFSYSQEEAGSLNPYTGVVEPASFAGAAGRYPVINATALDTTNLAAVAAWHVLQGFLGGLPQLDPNIKSKEFNLWTESYGGHYGPAFFEYFYEQNSLIANGTTKGIQLNFNTLGIINGIIDEAIQAGYYPEFATKNTYGIVAYNDTVYKYAKFANEMIGGCLDQISQCRATNQSSLADFAICAEAANMCRDNVEGSYYNYGNRGTYDIRHPQQDPTPPGYFADYLNLASTASALGVNLNYSSSNNDVYYAFQQTGDFIFPDFKIDLEKILNNSVRVALIYGDADYICNWFGGQAISLNINYQHKKEFAAAGYSPFLVNGTEYGEVRQYGNFSFLRMYESGHEVPYYQPLASLEMFKRTLHGRNVADGKTKLTGNYSSPGIANATHTESFVPLPTSTSASASGSSSSATAAAKNAHIPEW